MQLRPMDKSDYVHMAWQWCVIAHPYCRLFRCVTTKSVVSQLSSGGAVIKQARQNYECLSCYTLVTIMMSAMIQCLLMKLH